MKILTDVQIDGGLNIPSSTASRILSLNSSKEVTALDTTVYPDLTELSYVKGLQSSIQPQLDAITTGYVPYSGATTDVTLGSHSISASNLSGTNTGDNAVNSLYSGLSTSKQNVITLTTTGTSGPATFVNSTLNIPQYSGSGGGATVEKSSRFTWLFPDNTIDPTADLTANKWNTVSCMWYEINSSGDFVKRDTSAFGSNFYYTAANALLVRQNCVKALVNASTASLANIDALVSSSTKTNAFVTEMITFCEANNFDGVDLDLEGYGDWTATTWANFQNFVSTLGTALHNKGLLLSIEVPPIWNEVPGGPNPWDSANSQGYYQLRYQAFNDLPVDQLVVMAYDYQFDYGAGEPNQPLAWLSDILHFARGKINEGKINIVAGIPSAGYSGTTGGFTTTGRTYDYLSVQTGFSGATRDTGSSELIWANAGTSYVAIDDTAVQNKVAIAESCGIYTFALWHLGQNKYGGANLNNFSTSKANVNTAEQSFRLTANGSTISTTANFFGSGSGVNLEANSEYEVEFTGYFLKTTAGTVTFSMVNSVAPASMSVEYRATPATGVVAVPGTATFLDYVLPSTTLATYTLTTASLTTAVNHYASFKLRIRTGATASTFNIQAAASAGTITPLANSNYVIKKLPAFNVGSFV